jgi:hypothetical protein
MPNQPIQDGNYLGGLAAKVGEHEAYLGDPDTADGIVRGFIAQVLAAHAREDDAAFGKTLNRACIDTADVFLGTVTQGRRPTDPAMVTFLPVADWNREGGGLGQWVRPRFADQIDGIEAMTDADMLANVFAILALAVTEVIEKAAEDDDTQDAVLSLDAMVDDWRNLVMGIPNEDDTTASMLLVAEQAPPTDYDGGGDAVDDVAPTPAP